MNLSSTPLTLLQPMCIDDVVLLMSDISTGLGAVVEKTICTVIGKEAELWVHVYVCCVRLPAVMLMVTGELSVKDSFSVRTAKR